MNSSEVARSGLAACMGGSVGIAIGGGSRSVWVVFVVAAVAYVWSFVLYNRERPDRLRAMICDALADQETPE